MSDKHIKRPKKKSALIGCLLIFGLLFCLGILVPGPLMIRGVSPAVGMSAGGDKVMLDVYNLDLNPESELAVYFGGALGSSVEVLNDNSIVVVTPAYPRNEVVDVKVTQERVGESIRSATLDGAFQYVTPATLSELNDLIERIGEEATIRELRSRGIQDTATVSGSTELTKRINGREYRYDVNRVTEINSPIGSVIKFSASYKSTLGFFETDQNLDDFVMMELSVEEQKLIDIEKEAERKEIEASRAESEARRCKTCNGRGRVSAGFSCKGNELLGTQCSSPAVYRYRMSGYNYVHDYCVLHSPALTAGWKRSRLSDSKACARCGGDGER